MPEAQTYEIPQLVNIIDEKLNDSKLLAIITEGYSFDVFDTINKIELYRASQFKSGNTDSQGDRKYFLNISNAPAGNVTKNIDLDSSDFTILAEDGQYATLAFLYREALKQWLEKKRVGSLLNRIAEALPIYGQVILKQRSKTDIEFVPLRYLHRDPGILGIQKSSYVIQHHRFQPEDLKRMQTWDSAAINEVLNCYFKSGDKQINVYEFYGWVPKSTYEGANARSKDEEYIKVHCFAAMHIPIQGQGQDPKEANSFNKVLFKELWDKPYPYKELNLFEIEGRALGLGIFEMLFDTQVRTNEIEYQVSKSLKTSSKHVYQTTGDIVEQNLLTDLEDGQIIKTTKEITPIATEERNISTYTMERNFLADIARQLSNSQEVVSGDSLGSGTPYRLGLLLNQNASKLHEFIREKFALFFEDVLTDWIIPHFESEMKDEFIMEIQDPSLVEHIVNEDINSRLTETWKNYLLQTGEYPTQAELDLFTQQMKKEYKGKEFVKVLKDYFKFDKRIHVVSTGENVNVKQKVETLNNAIQLISQNPQALTMPETKRLISTLFELVGISPLSFSSSPNEPLPAMNQSMGGGQPQMDQAISQGIQGVPKEQQSFAIPTI